MLTECKQHISGFNQALDCGGGIGRVAKAVLLPLFDNVDLLDQSKVQIAEARVQVPQVRDFI